MGRTPQEHVLCLGVRVLEACQSNRPCAGLRPGPRGNSMEHLRGNRPLHPCLAWEPAHCTLPSSAGVGFFRGNHGNAFVSQAELASLPAFSSAEAGRAPFQSLRLQHPLTVGPPGEPAPDPGMGTASLSGPEMQFQALVTLHLLVPHYLQAAPSYAWGCRDARLVLLGTPAGSGKCF